MAVVSITFDTVSKAMTAALDGVPLADVVGCSISQSYADEDEYRCQLYQAREDKPNGMTTMTTLVASAEGLVPAADPAALGAELAAFFRRGD